MILHFKTLFILFFITKVLSHNTHNTTIEANKNKNKNTFLIKTNLTKEELESLLQEHEGQTKVVNLKNNIYQDGDNITTEEGLNREIEDEIRDDALIPLDEFHVKEVKTSETTNFIVQKNNKLIDTLYERKFGKIYAYLTIAFFIFAMIYFNNLNGNKNAGDKNGKFNNYIEFDDNREYMLAEYD